MTDPRKTLTEETPENQKDFADRGLTEVKGQIKADPSVITETLPIEEDEEDGTRRTLLG